MYLPVLGSGAGLLARIQLSRVGRSSNYSSCTTVVTCGFCRYTRCYELLPLVCAVDKPTSSVRQQENNPDIVAAQAR